MTKIEFQNGPSVDHLLSRASPLLDRVEHQVQIAVHVTKDSVYRDGKLDEQLFDQFQNSCYVIAVAKAELEAAKSLLLHAQSHPDAVLLKPCATYFCSQTIKTVLSTLANEAIALGLDRKALLALLADDEIDSWLTLASAYEDLASYCLESGNSRLESGLSEEQELVRSTFQRFADEVVAPRAEEIHRQDQDIPEEIIKPAAELGCFGTCIPERFGGLQPDDRPDSLGMIIVTEELSRGSLGAAGSLITRPEIAARALLAGGTEAQQTKWLPQLATGEKLCAISITEPNTGSDVAAVALRATACEGGWRLNGSKTWCTFAGRSELVVVLARTDSDATLGHKGLSLFLVEKPVYPGHEFEHKQPEGGAFSGKSIATLGYRGMHSYQLFFDDYFVADDCLIGEEEGEGKGFYYTMAGFAGGRLQTAARATGVMQAAFEAALSYATDRKIFDKTLAEFQLTQTKLTRMLATITASRQFSHTVAKLMDQGAGQMEASLVKLFSCRAAEWVAREAMQIHGGMGYAEESAVSRYFVDARVLSIFEGAEEVLAIRVIARGLMEQHDSNSFRSEQQELTAVNNKLS
ncbi:MAG: acyl-CoA/acyl-ACP dehydrogenase [Pseudomonadales bacterium]|nr:acyl-CoA/acyl-ACP dehydrogenase [Pseudomonadales bacterium]